MAPAQKEAKQDEGDAEGEKEISLQKPTSE